MNYAMSNQENPVKVKIIIPDINDSNSTLENEVNEWILNRSPIDIFDIKYLRNSCLIIYQYRTCEKI